MNAKSHSSRINSTGPSCAEESVPHHSSEPQLNQQSSRSPSTPRRILEISWGIAEAACLMSAIEFEIFSAIKSGQNTVQSIASTRGLSERGVSCLLTGLASMGLIHRSHESTYSLSQEARTYLCSDSPMFLGGIRHVYHGLNQRIWPDLSSSVRSGRPVKELFSKFKPGVWEDIVSYLDVLGTPVSIEMCNIVSRQRDEPKRILDVGCGSGLYGHQMALTFKSASVFALDREDVVLDAARRADEKGFADRFFPRACDLMDGNWGRDYDVVILSHLLHGYGADDARRIVRHASNSLAAGGTLIINEFIPDVKNAQRTPMQSLFGLQLLLTSMGRAYTLDTYERWLTEENFTGVEICEDHYPMSLLSANRRFDI